MSALDLLVLALATWRVAYMIANEHGPFRVFERLRNALPLGGLTTCLYCLSVWVGLLFYVINATELAWVTQVCAVSGAALMLYRYTGGGHVS